MNSGARFLGKRCATSLLPQVNLGRIETARQVQAGRGISSTRRRFRLTSDATQAFHPEELARNSKTKCHLKCPPVFLALRNRRVYRHEAKHSLAEQALGVICLDFLIHVELRISAFRRTRWACDSPGYCAVARCCTPLAS